MILVVDWPVGLVRLGESLVINAYWTLKVLELNINVTGDNYHPLCELSCGSDLSLGTIFLKSFNWT